MKRPVIAILASGGGTTAEAFIRAGAAGHITTTVGLVICNNKQAGIFQRIDDLNHEYGFHISCTNINGKTHPPASDEIVPSGAQTKAEELAIMKLLQEGNFAAIILMGYLKRIGPLLVHEFGWRPQYHSPYQAKMLNTHPGFLPDTKGTYGIHAQELVVANKLPYAGQTLHVVAEDYDDGPIIAEHKVKVEPGDTAALLFARVQVAEKANLPLDVDSFIQARQAYYEGTKE